MSFLSRSSLAAFISAAALLAGCKAELNIKINSKQSDDSNFRSSVLRVNDKVSIEVERLNAKQKPEHFEFQCDDKAGMEAVYNQAAADSAKLAERVDAELKSVAKDLLDKPDAINKIKTTMDELHYSRGKADALQQAINICENKIELN